MFEKVVDVMQGGYVVVELPAGRSRNTRAGWDYQHLTAFSSKSNETETISTSTSHREDGCGWMAMGGDHGSESR